MIPKGAKREKEKYIIYIYKNKKVAEAKMVYFYRASAPNVLAYKIFYKNESTGRYVKFLSWYKISTLSEEIKELIKHSYPASKDQRTIDAYDIVRFYLTDETTIVLGPEDEFVSKICSKDLWSAFLIKRNKTPQIEIYGYVKDDEPFLKKLKHCKGVQDA